MYIFLDAADNSNTISVVLFNIKDNKTKIIKKISSEVLAEDILVLIDRILKQNKLLPNDIKGIAVTTGPGPFTAIRVSLSIANGLAYGLKIPIIGIVKQGDSVEKMIKSSLNRFKKAKTGKYVTEITLPKIKK